MSTDDDSPDFEIEDSEGYVDRRRKEEIIENRQAIRQWRRELLSEARLGKIGEERIAMLLGDRVREYLMSIEPLLRDYSLPGAEGAYVGESVGAVVLSPPADFMEKIQSGDIVIQGGEPEPRQRRIQGLKEVIETEQVSTSWEVQIRRENPDRGQDKRETVTKTASKPLPRAVLTNAVRVADNWLQNAGVGLAISDGRPRSNYSD